MNHASLFSGIGGFDLAAEWMGWINVFNCEIDKFCQKVLKYHFPDAIQLGDIKQAKFKRDERGNVYIRRTVADTDGAGSGIRLPSKREWEKNNKEQGEQSQSEFSQGCEVGIKEKAEWQNIGPVDIITGGFPCQPFSAAGKRRGTEDDRHLWPEMLRAISEIKPHWVVGENVFGFTNWNGGLVFRQVLSELENEGYEVQPFIIPACAINAPHRRDRVWIVAHRTIELQQGDECGKYRIKGKEILQYENGQTNTEQSRTVRQDGSAADTDRSKRCEGRLHQDGGKAERHAGTLDARQVRTDWHDFPTQPPLRSRDDGFSGGLDGITVSKLRNESIKAYGDEIVPQVALQIFKAIEQYETGDK